MRLFLAISSISGLLAVCLGAFGAHALKDRLTQSGMFHTYQTAVQYHFYHTLALLAIALLLSKYNTQWLHLSGYAMTFGILLFSGSLYLMCFTGHRWLGAITPLGGVLFVAGWGCLLVAAIKNLS